MYFIADFNIFELVDCVLDKRECSFFVRHQVFAAANHLHVNSELAWPSVRKLPLETAHKFLTKGYRNFEDEAIVRMMSLITRAYTT